MEARLDPHNILLVLSQLGDETLLQNFYGNILTIDESSSSSYRFVNQTVYICGDLSKTDAYDLTDAARVLIVRDLSLNYSVDDLDKNWSMVDLGQVPIRVHDVGVLYRGFFDSDRDYFTCIQSEHTLQSLTQSTKSNKALRTGIYLTPVRKIGSEHHFRLLRCSANLGGPTDNFRASDIHIVDALNAEAAYVFENQASLNHVLAQCYHNTAATQVQKQTKAKMPAHADKTKDMPLNGIMAFCTFYDKLDRSDKLRRLRQDPFDYGYKGVSALTRLRFRIKESIEDKYRGTLPSQFTVKLYPNSVFFMPLSTNRLYTHEIQPSPLDAELLPTRLGYVVRCSSTEAVHDGSNTYLKIDAKRVKLMPPTPEGSEELRILYARENCSEDYVNYGDKFPFSMNDGDYLAPGYQLADEFRAYKLPPQDNIFEELTKLTRLEILGRGREGSVLVKADDSGGIPIVRTTTKYKAPAQRYLPAHSQLAQQIQEHASLPMELNNALVETYTNAYTTMGYHSDQALDLADESFIAVYSCYEHPELETPPRMLIIESKESGEQSQIPMPHNSVIVFSTETNRRFKHKIVLDAPPNTPENNWLGITFRTSKTLVTFGDGEARFPNGARLELAGEEESREFYKLRRRENQEIDFAYTFLPYTISPSDQMEPVSVG